MKKLTYLLIGSVFLGAQILALDLGVAKLSMYRLMLLLITAAVILLVFQNNPKLKLPAGGAGQSYRRIFFVWVAYAVISVIWVKDLSGWLNGLFFLVCGTVSIIYISLFLKTKKDIQNTFTVVLGMIVLHNAIGWLEILTGKYLYADLGKLDRYNTFVSQPSTRIPISIYANQNDYATLLLAGIAIAFIFYRTSKRAEVKLFNTAVILSSVFLLYRTGSRGTMLGLLIGIAILTAAKYINLAMLKKTTYFVLGLCLLSVLIFFLSSSVREFVLAAVDDALKGSFAVGRSNRTRINLILNGFMFTAQTFGLGTGAGNVEYWMENYAVLPVGDIVNMHNWFMDILTGYGVFVFALYIIMYVLIIRQLYINYKYSNDLFIKNASWVLLAYVGAFIVASTSSASNMFIEWQWVFWGVIIAFVQYCERTKETHRVMRNAEESRIPGCRMLSGSQQNELT